MEELAFVKMMLHIAKHPWSNAFGLLLSKDGKSTFVDCLPLFHTPLLSPSLEVALLLSGEHCSQTSHSIAAAYFCGEQAMLPLVKRVMTQLGERLGKSLQLVVVQQGAAREDVLQALVSSGGNEWKNSSKVQVKAECWQALNAKLVDKADLMDFDDSLDDVSKDFRNPHLG